MEASDFMKPGKSEIHAMSIISQAGEGGDSMFDNRVKIAGNPPGEPVRGLGQW